MMINNLEKIYNDLLNGDMHIAYSLEFGLNISKITKMLLDKKEWSIEDQHIADLIIRISNILYNNTSLDVLPLDDGLYDQLLVIYKTYNENYQIGSIPVIYDEVAQNDFEEPKVMVNIVTDKELDSKLYVKDIWKQYTSPYSIPKYNTMCWKVRDPISKRIINTKHSYPELVGTLDKCKFVLNNDAIEKDVFDKPSVQVFERDFIHKCLSNGIINPNEEFEMVGELKYDGISVEADICGDTIISARSRGDTAEDIATDLTPILGGYKFINAKNVPTDITFGMKFEAVILKHDLEKMSAIRGKSYKNCRNAIIGLFGSSDAYKFVDYITLIPLATSLNMDRITELEFINKYYNSGQYNRYCIFNGDYKSILFQIKQFTESAEIVRKVLPYLIDGVVISFTDPDKISKLGRVNSVNKYSMAIKFNPKKVRTQFIGYTYSIGKSGDVIPMIHFKPCEFIGTIHTKQTAHSYKRFTELDLHKGDQIDIEYVNEVLSYITKPDTEFNRNNAMNVPAEKFIEFCPHCGSSIVISESGKSARCVNQFCPERNIMRMVDMIERLGFKDFSEETVRTLNIISYRDLINMTYENARIIGEVNASNFMNRINNLINNPIEDYKILSALGFEGMADEKWKVILKVYTINDIINLPHEELYNGLININSIGPKIADIICNNRILYKDDLDLVIKYNTIINSKDLKDKPKIAFTGFRNMEFINILNENGFDASDKYTVNKNIYCLITNDKNSTSSKMVKAKNYGIPIYTMQEFIDINNIKL